MALLQIRRGNNGTKGTLQYGEPFFNSTLQTVQFGASGSEEITLVKLNTGLSGSNVWGESGSFENSGSLSLVGDITASNAFFRGNVFVSGNLRLGNNDLDSVTVEADFTSDLIPNESASYDLGSAAKYWNTAYLGSLSLAGLAGADAENNIVYVNNANQLTASNDFEYIPGDQVRIGSGSEDRFWVKINTGDTFVSGNLFVSGNNGIALKANISSSQGFVTAVSAAFDNLRAPGGSNDSIVIASNGYLTNTSDLRFVGDGLDIGNNKFTVNKTNGNTFTSGTLHALGQFSGSSAILRQTLQVDGGTTLNNQLSVLGPTANVNINQNLRVDGSGSFGNGLDVAGNVVLNVGGAGTVFISGSSRLGDDAQNDSVVISGSFSQIFTGTSLQNLFVRNSAVKSSSITFDDDNSPLISGLPPIAGKIVVRNRSNDGTLDSYLITNVTSSVLSVTNATAASAGRIGIEYLNTATSNSIRVNIAATDGINLNSRTQIASNLSVSGSTILGRDNDDLLTIASPTTMSGNVFNQGYTANLGTVKISSSLQVTGSTELLGIVTMGDLNTSASGLVEGSASIAGDLTVRGNAVYLGVDRVSTEANLIELASGSTAGFEAEGAGLYVSTSLVGGNASIRYSTTGSSERFIINKGVYIIGDPNDGYGLQISNNTHITGNLDVDGNLSVDGNITLVNATITNAAINTLNVTASAAVTGNLHVNGNVSVTGSTTLGDAAGDNVQIPGTLNVSGAVKNGSTLNVAGAVGFNNVLRVTGSTAISGNLHVGGDEGITGSLTVKESSFFEKNLRVSGNLQVNGDVDILGEVVRINVSNLQIEDKNVIISKGSLSSLQSNDGGITIEGPTEAIQFTWDHANQRMNLNKDLNVSGNLLIQGDNIIDTAVALAIALS
jgi:cytoskeletal protein CcmA (bactofilin family)